MTRYQALRKMKCDPLTAAFISFLNFMFGVKEGYIGIMNITIEYDPN